MQYVRSKSETNSDYGGEPSKRSLEELLNKGLVIVDKPRGPTSHQVASWIKNILKVKVGHGGTLDPGVTGVLPIFLGKATKLADIILTTEKEYVCLMYLHEKTPKKKIEDTFKKMSGKIMQKPPVKSAVKRVEREREIYGIEIIEVYDQEVLFKIKCEAGTYIRKYCHDFGKALGCGANMLELRRTRSGNFSENDDFFVTLHELKDAYEIWKNGEEKYLRRCVLPMERAISELPNVEVHDSAVDSLAHGSELAVPGVSKYSEFQKGEIATILTLKGELVAIGKTEMDAKELKSAKTGIVVKPSKVFMDAGIYKAKPAKPSEE